LEKQPIGQLLRRHLLESGEIFAAYGNVDVVVPRNKAGVSHRAETRAAVEPVVDIVAAANLVDLHENLQLLQLQFAQMAVDVMTKVFVFHFAAFFCAARQS